jgi:hypothetical protein
VAEVEGAGAASVIRSQDVRPSPGVHGKGYKRSQFDEVWARYLPAEIRLPLEEGE